MYSIIIAIHAVFIFLSHILEYRFFEVFFLLLCIFFLFYFSPLFFLDSEGGGNKLENTSFEISSFFRGFSLKESPIIPLTFLYIALYVFVIGLFGFGESILLIHSSISIGIFLILFGYTLSFDWKNDLFYEVFQYHSILSFPSLSLIGILFIFQYIQLSFVFLVFGIVSTVGGIFFLSISRNIMKMYTVFFLSTLLSTLFLLVQYFFHFPVFTSLLSLIVIFGMSVFEYFPRIRIFSLQTVILRQFSLISLLTTTPFLLFLLLSDITLPFLLLVPTTIFFYSIHIRYSNYIAYGIGLGITYFLYSVFFFSLLSSGSLFSILLFIFFLPFLLIGITYFWEEQYEYDFIILHYSSIMFSGIYSIYSIFFIGWGMNFLFVISSCIFGLAILLFLSYFRFRKA